MPQAILVYNPLAGPVDQTGNLRQAAELWRAQGWSVDMRATEYPGHAQALAQEAAATGVDLVLAAGGDGTLGDVANGLAGSQTVMGPLPGGTANSFCKELGLPIPNLLNPEVIIESATQLLSGRVQAMDLGYTHSLSGHGRYWLLWSGAGADGWLVEQVEPRPRWSKKLGPAGYALQGLLVSPRLPAMHAAVTIDGRRYTGDFIMVVASNCRYYAGEVVLSPRAQLDDGRFEIWLYQGRGLRRLYRHIWLTWRGRHHNVPDITCIHGRSLEITTQTPIAVQTDGEMAGHTPLSVTIKPGALRLLAPPTAPADLFSLPGQPLA